MYLNKTNRVVIWMNSLGVLEPDSRSTIVSAP